MKKRQHSPTSKAAHDSVKPFKEAMWLKIEKGLEEIKIGATFDELATHLSVHPDQVWRRLSELEEQGRIYKTGITRTSARNRKATVWQRVANLPKTEKERTIQKQLSFLT